MEGAQHRCSLVQSRVANQPAADVKTWTKPATEWKLKLGMIHPEVSKDEKDTERHLRQTPSQLTVSAGITLENLDGKYIKG